MKALLFSLVFFVSMSQIQAQQNNYATLILGKWELDFDKSIAKANTTTKSTFGQMSTDQKEQAKGTFDKQVIKFSENGKYSLKCLGQAKVKGTWKLSENKEILKITLESGELQKFKIAKLKNNKLKLNLREDENESAVFKNWHYNKTTK